MSEFALIRDLAIIWLTALFAGYVCVRSKMPVIAGYILSGVLIGPFGLKLIVEAEQIHVLAEFGVALLLFALGVEVSLKQILGRSSRVIVAGLLQIGLTIAAFFGISLITGMAGGSAEAFLFGAICALSSSVVVTRVLMDRGELDSIHGQLLIPFLIIQDISLVPLISLIPVLKDPQSGLFQILVLALLKAGVLVLIVIWGATRLVPYLLSRVVHSNYRELFLLLIISLCLVIALASNYLGLSLALGAFLAGIMISESTYGHQALAELLPLRDLFSIVFFVSVGMLLDPAFIAGHWPEVLLFLALLIAGKAVIGAGSARVATRSNRSAMLTGVGLAQIGEFSFVVAMLGTQAGIVSPSLYNLFLSGAVVSLIAAPLLMGLAPALLHRLGREPESKEERRKSDRSHDRAASMTDHVILLGFGRTGRNLGQVLHDSAIPFVVVELNAAIIDELEKLDIALIYGDAASRVALLRTNLRSAACLVITIHDPIATLTIIELARQINPDIKIIARAHREEDIEVFRAAGANAVVQPEFEAGIEMTRLTLLGLNRSDPQIKSTLAGIRQKRYSIFKPDIAEPDLHKLVGHMHADHMTAWFVFHGEDTVEGKTLKELDIRKNTGATVLAIKRGESILPHPGPDESLEMNDELYVTGDAGQLAACEDQLWLRRFCPLWEVI